MFITEKSSYMILTKAPVTPVFIIYLTVLKLNVGRQTSPNTDSNSSTQLRKVQLQLFARLENGENTSLLRGKGSSKC